MKTIIRPHLPKVTHGLGDQDRFTDAMNRVTDLLKVNQHLRDEINDKEEAIRRRNAEAFEIREESEDLRERIELLERVVSNDEGGY